MYNCFCSYAEKNKFQVVQFHKCLYHFDVFHFLYNI